MALENRSLERGLMVLEALSRRNALSLAELHRETGLAKSTLRRLLGTLVARRAVRRSLADGLYRSNVVMPVSAAVELPVATGPFADRAMPHLLELTGKVSWPSDLHMVAGDRMVIVDSTRPASPFHLYPGRIHRELNIFGAASGMAALSAMPGAQVARVAARTAGDQTWGLARFAMTLEGYGAQLEDSRRRGYGIRLPAYTGETVLDDRLWAIAVPVFRDVEVTGAITLIWPRVFNSIAAFAGDHLAELQRTAERVSRELAAPG